eukprot:1151493-Pelagomonas_calceolata.AAC.8
MRPLESLRESTGTSNVPERAHGRMQECSRACKTREARNACGYGDQAFLTLTGVFVSLTAPGHTNRMFAGLSHDRWEPMCAQMVWLWLAMVSLLTPSKSWLAALARP